MGKINDNIIVVSIATRLLYKISNYTEDGLYSVSAINGDKFFSFKFKRNEFRVLPMQVGDFVFKKKDDRFSDLFIAKIFYAKANTEYRVSVVSLNDSYTKIEVSLDNFFDVFELINSDI